jgi:adenylate kinase
MASIRIAITGAPGVGKSAFCAAANAAGWPLRTVLELAVEADAVGPLDKSDDSRPIDVEMLISKLAFDWHPSNPEDESKVMTETNLPTLIDGHISHLLPVDAVCIIRCNPKALRARLEARNYPDWKVETNVEWELLGGAWGDRDDYGKVGRAVKKAGWRRVFEVDSTAKSPEECFKKFVEWFDSGAPSIEPADAIDWISNLSD